MGECRQDMPPPGGYSPIVYKRIPLKTGSYVVKCGALFGALALGWTMFELKKRERLFRKVEERCSALALEPLLQAERDRMVLKQIRKDQEEEERIMEGVEGWEVGKWKGMNIYDTLGENEYYDPMMAEMFAHARESDLRYPRILHRF
ncbi:hypothetical protein RUM43_004881 [Polyplax serrata]|uniref:NADH dehydrogenase [ubiquinone] 1 alpha subcomplex subunit 13 n=1 Tax=Polyplax serrata TaxID=468196 RepID=A0AAN8XNX1_POLSC